MKAKRINSISIFFPAYNEEENVKEAVLAVESFLNNKASDFEIIIVNDGSKDKTKEIAENLAKSNSRVKVINHSQNFGYGRALISGFEAATKDLIFFTDCDLQFDLEEMEKLLEHIDEHDAVIGFRNPRRDPMMRIINAWGWKVLNRLLFGLKVKDIDCAFKLFRREAIEDIEIKSNGAMVSAEFLIKMKDKGAKIKEVPVSHYPRKKGSQSGAKLNVVLKAFKELIKFYSKWEKK